MTEYQITGGIYNATTKIRTKSQVRIQVKYRYTKHFNS